MALTDSGIRPAIGRSETRGVVTIGVRETRVGAANVPHAVVPFPLAC